MIPDLVWPALGAVVTVLSGLGAIVGWVLREFSKRDRDIADAKDTADREITILKSGFGDLRLHVAEKYATKEGVTDSLKSVHDAIERLADRIEKLTDRLISDTRDRHADARERERDRP